MKLLLSIFAVCALGRVATQTANLHDMGSYWRPWNVTNDMPGDAFPGGIDTNGQPTYVARTFHAPVPAMLPGKACAEAKKMWFELDSKEYEKTTFVEILCALNQNRLKWVTASDGDEVERVVKGDELIIGGHNPSYDYGIGRQRIGNEIQLGRFGRFKKNIGYLILSQSGKTWIAKKFEVLVYVKNQFVECGRINIEIE